MAAPALAADFVGGGGDDLWSNSANWSPAGVPTLASGALSIKANADVQTSLTDRIGGVLTVDSGQELIINADFGHALTETNMDVWLNGTITQNGGDVWFSDDTRPGGGGTYTMNGGTFVNRDYWRFDAAGTIDIRGGSFNLGTIGQNTQGLNMNGNSSTLKVVGNAPTLISIYKITSFGSGTLDIVLKDGGITTIDVTGDANLPGTLNVTLDAGFVLPTSTTVYTLIDAGSLSGAIGTATLPSTDWSVATVGNDVVLTYAPPGTSTFAITEIDYDPDADTVTLTWRSRPNTTYKAPVSSDLSDWGFTLASGLDANNDENTDDGDHITVTFPLNNDLKSQPDLFFRIEEEQPQ